MMQIAKWNETTQTPYDIRDRNSVTASNGVPYRDMASLNRIGYYEYQPVQLAEGEGLDDVTYSKPADVIMEGGTVVSAAEMQARVQAAQAQATKKLALSIPDNVMAAYIDFRLAISNAAYLATELGLSVADDISYQGLDAALQTLMADAPDAADWHAIAANIERKWNRVVALTGRTLGEAYSMIPLLDLRMELNKEGNDEPQE